jgi:tRNA G26 N,N-dimethylase Trm1
MSQQITSHAPHVTCSISALCLACWLPDMESSINTFFSFISTTPATQCVSLRLMGKKNLTKATRHTSHLTPHSSHITHHTSHITHHTSHITHHKSHITHHTSHITHHTSHITHHTSHITHVTHHTCYTSDGGRFALLFGDGRV